MTEAARPTTRLHVLIARGGHRGVIFRRGPSKQVLLVDWELRRDRFTPGQWLKGRVYEHRCDLSPDGELLVYFAAKWTGPFHSWTAISRPPYFTALALWPKGDAWGGGGLFEGPSSLQLNHPSHQFALADGFRTPKRLRIAPMGEHSGSGEDVPIYWRRLQRDGWTLHREGTERSRDFGAEVWIVLDPAEAWTKPQPRGDWTLWMERVGIKERDGPWYQVDYTAVRGEERFELGRTDWADWCASGDLLFARDGKLFRTRLTAKSKAATLAPVELVDLADQRFSDREPPPAALTWDRRRRR